jgi:hypothetical protein
MANELKMAIVEAIYRLHALKWSARRIARELGIDRGTVGRYLKLSQNESKPAISPPGSCDSKPATFPGLPGRAEEETGCVDGAGDQVDSKPAISPPGSEGKNGAAQPVVSSQADGGAKFAPRLESPKTDQTRDKKTRLNRPKGLPVVTTSAKIMLPYHHTNPGCPIRTCDPEVMLSRIHRRSATVHHRQRREASVHRFPSRVSAGARRCTWQVTCVGEIDLRTFGLPKKYRGPTRRRSESIGLAATEKWKFWRRDSDTRPSAYVPRSM